MLGTVKQADCITLEIPQRCLSGSHNVIYHYHYRLLGILAETF